MHFLIDLTLNRMKIHKHYHITFTIIMKKLSYLIAFAIAMCSISYAQSISVTLDDFAGLNTAASNNDLSINNYDPGLTGVSLAFGAPASGLGRDAWGTGTSKFGQSGAWFDGSFAKFGNSGNQMQLDYKITNNSGDDFKLTNIAFDIRTTASAVTSWQNVYLATGSNLVKGSSADTGSSYVNLKGMGTGSINSGINNYSISLGSVNDGTSWLADGDSASFRITLSNTGAAQLDNFVVTGEVVPEPSTYALIFGIITLAYVRLRRKQ